MKREQLANFIREQKTCLCVGLDSDRERIPPSLSRGPRGVLEFNKRIIDATKDVCVAYKINTAFYESMGRIGWEVIEETIAHIPRSHFLIADAKRGDIGNTSRQYAKAFLQEMPFDAITVAPYMGEDSIKPFMDFEDKWVIILGLTSNKGSHDFQKLKIGNQFLWEIVMEKTARYGTDENTMYVVGATRTEDFETVRKIIPNHFLLVPGVGAQGGNLEEVLQQGIIQDTGLLVNASRAVIFASDNLDFEIQAYRVARDYREIMKAYL